MFGCGSVAQWLLSNGASGTYLSVNLTWGLGVAMGVWISGTASGEGISTARFDVQTVMLPIPRKGSILYSTANGDLIFSFH